MAPLLAVAAKFGLDFVTDLIADKGEDLVTEGIKKVTGIDLTKKEPSPEDIQRINDFKLEIQKLDFEKLKLELDAQKEDNRHEETTAALEHGNTADARNMNVEVQKSGHASDLSKVAAYYIDFAIIGGTLILGMMLFFKAIPTENQEVAYLAFGSLLTLAASVVNYHRGSSAGSKEKTKLLKG